jgi:hypothetical protein
MARVAPGDAVTVLTDLSDAHLSRRYKSHRNRLESEPGLY